MATTTDGRMPAAFLGHGSPMNALETNLHERLARVRRERTQAARDPGRVRALVRRLHGGHGHAAPAHRFDDAARAILTERPHDIPSLQDHADFSRAVPTPDHFIPLLYIAGLADAGKCRARVLVDGYAYGSLSMTC